jgi:hypothetical protein
MTNASLTKARPAFSPAVAKLNSPALQTLTSKGQVTIPKHIRDAL